MVRSASHFVRCPASWTCFSGPYHPHKLREKINCNIFNCRSYTYFCQLLHSRHHTLWKIQTVCTSVEPCWQSMEHTPPCRKPGSGVSCWLGRTLCCTTGTWSPSGLESRQEHCHRVYLQTSILDWVGLGSQMLPFYSYIPQWHCLEHPTSHSSPAHSWKQLSKYACLEDHQSDYLPGPKCAAPHIAGDTKLCLEILCSWHVDMQLVQGNCVAHFQAGWVTCPAPMISSVEKTVTEKNKVSWPHSFPWYLLQLPLLQQFSSRSDELPVTQPRLQLKHCLKLILWNNNS